MKNYKGMTLIEILSALAIAALLTVAFAQIFLYNGYLVKISEDNTKTAVKASQITENLLSGGSVDEQTVNGSSDVLIKNSTGRVLYTIQNANIAHNDTDTIMISYKGGAAFSVIIVDKYEITTASDKDNKTRFEVYIPK
jgi:prepilin-type N-terminal cleavage/methylation domain-containing protein